MSDAIGFTQVITESQAKRCRNHFSGCDCRELGLQQQIRSAQAEIAARDERIAELERKVAEQVERAWFAETSLDGAKLLIQDAERLRIEAKSDADTLRARARELEAALGIVRRTHKCWCPSTWHDKGHAPQCLQVRAAATTEPAPDARDQVIRAADDLSSEVDEFFEYLDADNRVRTQGLRETFNAYTTVRHKLPPLQPDARDAVVDALVALINEAISEFRIQSSADGSGHNDLAEMFARGRDRALEAAAAAPSDEMAQS